jgi:hypothetical protein
MFEVWAEKSKPSVRLVLKSGSGMPAELGARDWIKVGPITPDPAIAAQVEAKSYAFFETDEAVPDPDRLKNAEGSGA